MLFPHAAHCESERLQRREMFVTIAPGTLDMEALGSLAPVISAQDPKLIHKTLTMRCTHRPACGFGRSTSFCDHVR